MKRSRMKKGIVLFAASLILVFSAFFGTAEEGQAFNLPFVKRPDRPLTMKAARALAVEESMEYFQAEQTISSKQAALKSAQKSIKLKQKNMSTFRWSPLLSFKFPTKPNEAEAFEFQFKPVSIQAEIDEAVHKLTDIKLSTYETVNKLYVDIVVLQRTIEFNEYRIQVLEEGLARNKARLLTGEATQADVDSISKKLDSTKETLANKKRSLSADLRKLSDKVGTDVSTGYSFETPFLEASIPRQQLPSLIQYTLDRDQTYYKACLDETTARIDLNTNYKLMANHYGSDINMISSYVSMALNGQQLKGSAQKGFKKDYDAFIERIDSYWQGKKRILFIKIPRLWFKGSLDGARYIEDDPYVLYQSTLDYASAATDKLAAEADLEEQVIDSFENYISVRNSYIKMAKDIEEAEKQLEADLTLNRLGELSFDEYNSEMDDYEELQNSFFELMKTYSETLYAFDRLTCGGISAFLSGDDSSLNAGTVGTSYVEKDISDGASYYIRQLIQNEAFELSIYIPEDFDVELTHFELWCDNVQVGKRTEITKSLRHLSLTTSGVTTAKVRLYNGDEFVDDVVIDPSEPSGPLPIVKDRRIVKNNPDEIGIVELSTNSTTGLMSFRLDITEDPEAAFYQVKDSEGVIFSGREPVANGKEFRHLALVESGLEEAVIDVMDKDKNVLYQARFDMKNHRIRKVEQ